MTKIIYSEPASYFPKKIRKKCGLGEFNEEVIKQQKERKNKKSQWMKRKRLTNLLIDKENKNRVPRSRHS